MVVLNLTVALVHLSEAVLCLLVVVQHLFVLVFYQIVLPDSLWLFLHFCVVILHFLLQFCVSFFSVASSRSCFASFWGHF